MSHDLLELLRAMRGGVLGKNTFACPPSDTAALFIGEMDEDVRCIRSSLGHEDLLVLSKELREAGPRIRENGSTACGGLEESHRRRVPGLYHVRTREVESVARR